MDTLNAKTGVPFAPLEFTPLNIAEGLTITNESAGPRTAGKVAVMFLNTDEYGGDDLVITVAVTAQLTESGASLDAIPVACTVAPEEGVILGPFGLEHEGAAHAVEFTFTGQEGSYYAFYTR